MLFLTALFQCKFYNVSLGFMFSSFIFHIVTFQRTVTYFYIFLCTLLFDVILLLFGVVLLAFMYYCSLAL